MAGSLGTAALHWLNGYLSKLFIGLTASNISLEENSGDLDIKTGGALRVKIDSAGIDGTYLTDSTVGKGKQVARGEQTSSSSGSFTTTSVTLVDVTNLSVTITTSGRPVRIEVHPASTSDCFIEAENTGAGNSSMKVNIKRDTTDLVTFRMGATDGTSSANSVEYSPSVISYLEKPSAGTYTYKIQTLLAAGTIVRFNNCKLIAYEL